MNTVVGIGDFIAWDGGCLLIGRATSVTPLHSHYAIQIAFGVESGIRFRVEDELPWTQYDGAMIPSRQPHTMDATAVNGNVVLFVEPETPEGRALAERNLGAGVVALTPHEFRSAGANLFATWNAYGKNAPTVSAARAVVHALTGGVQTKAVSDERIIRATAYINGHLDAPLTLEEVAEAVHLSPSRFRHLFVEETGTAMRPYVLWRRFLRAWEIVANGGSLSAAAHSAGFADAAHLTRTSHRMFGFAPSALLLNERA